MKTEVYLKSPTPTSVRLINFTQAEVHPGFLDDTWILVVSGTKPYANMTVRLSPLIYVRRPEYWEIEVIGSLPGMGLPMTAPYTVSLQLDSSLGTEGVEVVGATKRKRIRVPPTASSGPGKKNGSKKSASKKK
jgi:hypothetical protein